MNKRTLTILLVILAVLAAVWLSNNLPAQNEISLTQAQSESGLALVDDALQTQATPNSSSATDMASEEASAAPESTQRAIAKEGSYTTKEDVSLYLYTYGHLPDNFMTKSEARALGWSGGGLDEYDYGMCIGGDRFGNYEGLLPESAGRIYYECDIDTLHEDSRGAKRIVFSNDGLIYYTEDHYESFDLLYTMP